jgi:hypothetical protein
LICDVCGVPLSPKETKRLHFETNHPEFKFHWVKRKKGKGSTMMCDICGKPVDSFAELVKKHVHPGGPETVKAKPLEILDNFFGNFEHMVKRAKLCDVYEERVAKYAAKIVELQNLLAASDSGLNR